MTDNRPGKWGQAFGFEGPVYTWGSKAFDVVLLSVYWTVGCIPVVTAGASASALYYAVDRSVFRDRGTATETFWRAYRENLKKGTAHWLLSLLLGFLFLLNFGICRANMKGHIQWFFCALYLVLTAVVIMNACWLFPMIAEFEMPFGWYLRGSLFCVFRYFPRFPRLSPLRSSPLSSVAGYPHPDRLPVLPKMLRPRCLRYPAHHIFPALSRCQ